MNTIIKEAMLIVAAVLATLSVSAQTEELWIDKYEIKYVVDTVAADSIEIAMNAAYNAERRERERKKYAAPFEEKIAIVCHFLI
jgi:predicted glycosyltransferase